MGGFEAAWAVGHSYGAAVGHLLRVVSPGLVFGEAHAVEDYQLRLQVRLSARAWEVCANGNIQLHPHPRIDLLPGMALPLRSH